jgi:hypothetical protein
MRFYKNIRKATFFYFLVGFVVSACYKEPNFALAPLIEFNSISKAIRLDQFTGAKKDSIVLQINYKDGDGDLGYNADEVGSVVPRTDYNYILKTFRKKNGIYTAFSPQENLSGFFPRLKNDEKKAPIEGKLGYRIQIETAFWPYKKDTVKFSITIKDRASNLSNTVESLPIIINEF